MPCSHCGNEKVLARGLCQPCYHRLRRSGSVARKNVQNRGPCRVDGCAEPAHAKGVCSLHYARQQHPLKTTWKLIRSRHAGLTPERWNSFEAFLGDVGERPGPRHQLRRIDETKPYSRGNVRWLAPIQPGKVDRKYAREWQLQNKFGLAPGAYDQMLDEQGGVCAICQQTETRIHHSTKKVAPLCVDHDHATGQVRGLLCVRCNRMLGYGRDNPEILRRAIAYLERHQETEAG